MDSVRIDKWLWAARCFKTRSRATTACGAGHARVNGEVVKASAKVSCGVMVEVHTPGGRRVLEVVALAERRGTVAAAEALYIDHTPPEPEREPDLFSRDQGLGRPTKRERRRQSKFRGGG